MGFNYGLEKKNFDSQWAMTRKQYEDAGMSNEAIQAMYDYDWSVFNANRSYQNHTQEMAAPSFEQSEESYSPLMNKYQEAVSVTDTYRETKSRFENLEANLRSVDKHVCELDASVSELQRSVKELWLHVENTTDWKLQVVAENHSNLLQKLEEQQKRWETQERLLFYVNKHEKDITAIKQRLCM